MLARAARTHADAGQPCAASADGADMTENMAPVGSTSTAIRPNGESAGGCTVVPPAPSAVATASSTLSTRKYVIQCGGASATAPCHVPRPPTDSGAPGGVMVQ